MNRKRELFEYLFHTPSVVNVEIIKNIQDRYRLQQINGIFAFEELHLATICTPGSSKPLC